MSGFTKIFREPVNGLTHAAGALLSLYGAYCLLSIAAEDGKSIHVIAFSIFGAGLVALYSTSAVYHLVRARSRTIALLRTIDHAMIYVLIASTYTPICLIALRESFGLPLLAIIWTIAAAGILCTLFWVNAPRWLSTSMYVAMGWLAVTAIVPLINTLSAEALAWLFAGGVFYTSGAVIYGVRRPDPFPGVFGFHEIWHLFVIAGSFCHYMLMYRGVLPLTLVAELR